MKESISPVPRLTNNLTKDLLKLSNSKHLHEKTFNRRGVKQLLLKNTLNSVKRAVSKQQDKVKTIFEFERRRFFNAEKPLN